MSIQQWIINTGTKGVMKDAEKDGRIAEAVTVANATIKGFFPGEEKTIKQNLVQYIIFPFCKILLKEDPAGYAQAKTAL